MLCYGPVLLFGIWFSDWGDHSIFEIFWHPVAIIVMKWWFTDSERNIYIHTALLRAKFYVELKLLWSHASQLWEGSIWEEVNTRHNDHDVKHETSLTIEPFSFWAYGIHSQVRQSLKVTKLDGRASLNHREEVWILLEKQKFMQIWSVWQHMLVLHMEHIWTMKQRHEKYDTIDHITDMVFVGLTDCHQK